MKLCYPDTLEVQPLDTVAVAFNNNNSNNNSTSSHNMMTGRTRGNQSTSLASTTQDNSPRTKL